MGEHSATPDRLAKLRSAVVWARTHKAAILAVAVAVTPLVTRFVPDFPVDGVMRALRVFLGA